MDVELATLTDEAPEGYLWLHEIKFDGYRMLCRIDGDDVRFISRNQQDWTEGLKPLAHAVKSLDIDQGMLDGEIVFMRKDGTTDFQALQNAFRDGKTSDIHYYVFDLVYLNGYRKTVAEPAKRGSTTILSSHRSRRLWKSCWTVSGIKTNRSETKNHARHDRWQAGPCHIHERCHKRG